MKYDKAIRKIQGIMGERSFSVILPKQYAMNLGVGKGDVVIIKQEKDKITIEKARD